MAKSDDSKMEAETIIRWDELDAFATLWTASPVIRREWESYLFPVIANRLGSGWVCRVPKNRISYKTYQKQAQKESKI
jgi:hypothetical protein